MDVKSLQYKGLRIWPFVRLQLWRRLLHPDKFAPPATIGLRHLAQTLSESFFRPEFYVPYLEHARRHRENLDRLSRAGPVEVLLFSRPDDHFDRLAGKHYNRFIDPIAELVQTRNTYLKIEPVSDKTPASLPRYEHTHFLETIDYIRCDAQRSLIAAFQKNGRSSELENGALLTRLLASIRFDLALTEEYLMVEAERLLHYKGYFIDLLSRLRPKVVFLAGYYRELAMPLVAACRELRIPSVDVQQRKVGAFHGMYTHWKDIPEDGYELLPDFFWCWSKADVENIQQWKPVSNGHHRPIIGGHGWLSKWFASRRAAALDDQELKPLLRTAHEQRKWILVSLQNKQDCLPDNLVEAIRISPPGWQWMLRVYPGMDHKIHELEALLGDLHLSNVDVDMPSRLSLYSMLRYADWHVSEGSTVCYEALRFGVPSLIIDPEGQDRYRDQFEKGHFVFAGAAKEILQRLNASPPAIRYADPQIVTDRTYALDALLEIMEEGRSLIPA